MKSSRMSALLVVLGAFVGCLALCGNGLAQPKELPLVVSDCNKCHIDVVTNLYNNGSMHKESFDCLGCHAEHAPHGSETIPDCSMCHDQSDAKHFSVASCSGCHDPHAPLDIDLSGISSVKEACLSCHVEPGEYFEYYPSAHSEMECNECHQAHGESFSCLDCHEAHSEEASRMEDCLSCHKPHMPSVVRYSDDLPVRLCASCHEDAVSDLGSTQFKHSEFNCTFCHRIQHRAIPDCGTCHGFPHIKSLHKKHPDCSECHNTAHVLEN